ncbi:MAG TPA: acetyl-CoA acetyltransferase [Acidimicrobiales bacterium]|jgi:acetyl-CoA C-acetyltransferase|nr:acetyl-CoA acetyltransferase [Acidimicrobiales bacterium]
MSLDPRLPVVVGVGQLVRHPEPDDVPGLEEPVDMMAEAARRAGQDSGVGDGLLRRADSIRTVDMLSWRYANPALLLAERLGCSPRQTLKSTVGGNSPQALVNDTADAIARGELDVALIAGAEAVYTRLLARKTKDWLQWTQQPDDTPEPDLFGDDRPGTNDVEQARSIVMPTQVYPVFENALRYRAGESIDEHQRKVSALWSGFSEVAARNSYAWSPERLSAEDIRTVTPDNRMIGFPYPKLMNSNIQTDQAAALIVCSVQAARDAGVPEDRWVFVHSGADAADHWWVSERDDLTSSPAIRACGQALGGVAEAEHVDLYSCFPAAVQIAAAELGLSTDRQLTVTGGLCFAGGPGNNYVTHSIAAMADVLRQDPGSLGLVTALGWYVTKHSLGLYSTAPPAQGFRRFHPQDEVDAAPRRAYASEHDGPVTVESYTVMHERDGMPVLGIVACLLPDGTRAWGNVFETGLLKAMCEEEFCGRAARLRADGALDVTP